MLTVYTDRHRYHDGRFEMIYNELVPCYERPARAEMILGRITEVGLGDVREPVPHDHDTALAVHDAGLLEHFERTAAEWRAAGREGDALPHVWPYRRSPGHVPAGVDARLGYYAMDAGTPITGTTWEAVRAGLDVTLTGVELLRGGERAAFALTRPPGHHSGRDYYGGYCFINNAAVATETLASDGRVAVLDVDYHHGNGTQDIFYERADVLFCSIHGDPDGEYPYYSGRRGETGAGEGAGTTANYPLPLGSDIRPWQEALDDALGRIKAFRPTWLVVSLGLDTFQGDPICQFRLRSDDYPAVGTAIARAGIPTLYVMEGGYAVDALGVNTVNVLTGHDEAL